VRPPDRHESDERGITNDPTEDQQEDWMKLDVPAADREQAWDRFWTESRKGKSWKGCEVCPPERRDPNALLEVHHTIRQQDIADRGKDLGWDDETLLRWLTDPRVGLLVCGTCHYGDTSRSNPIRRGALRPENFDYAKELDMLDYLDERYPR
jgi:hypothetical protein